MSSYFYRGEVEVGRDGVVAGRTPGAGGRGHDWAKLPANIVFDPDPPTHHRWVMARRSLFDSADLAYYLAYAPVGVEIAELARIAGSRWAIEKTAPPEAVSPDRR